MNDSFCNAVGVLKASTLKLLMQESGRAGQLAVDGWAASNPKQVKAWEKDGSLVQRAQEADGQAEESLRMAAADGVKHLAPHEIYEIYGGPMLKL